MTHYNLKNCVQKKTFSVHNLHQIPFRAEQHCGTLKCNSCALLHRLLLLLLLLETKVPTRTFPSGRLCRRPLPPLPFVGSHFPLEQQQPQPPTTNADDRTTIFQHALKTILLLLPLPPSSWCPHWPWMGGGGGWGGEGGYICWSWICYKMLIKCGCASLPLLHAMPCLL